MTSAAQKQLPNVQSSQLFCIAQTPLSMWRSRSLNRSGVSVVPAVKAEMVRTQSLFCVNLFLSLFQYPLRFPLPAPAPPPLSQSLLATEEKALLLVLPLDIRIRVDWRQATGHPTAVAAHIDEVPNEDQDGDSELGSRRVVRAVRRRVRFVIPSERRQTHRRVETAATPDDMWVAVGEVGPLD